MTKQLLKIAGFLLIIAIIFISTELKKNRVGQTFDNLNTLGNMGDNIPEENRVSQTFDSLSVVTAFSDAQFVVASDLDRGDIMTLYGGDKSIGPLWRWNEGGHAYVRTSLEIAGKQYWVDVGGYSAMLKLRSDLAAGQPALLIQTNPYEKYIGPLILGFDWDDTMTLAIQSDGSIRSAGIIQTSLQGDLEEEKIMYSALVGPEVGLYIRGTANLAGGKAIINFPDHFSEFTSEDDLTVYLTPFGDPLQLYVSNKSSAGITVHEASGKDGKFDYIIYGIRKGYEDYQPTKN